MKKLMNRKILLRLKNMVSFMNMKLKVNCLKTSKLMTPQAYHPKNQLTNKAYSALKNNHNLFAKI